MGGLCFRRYVPIRRIGLHPKSGMPLSDEVRVYSIRTGRVAYRYWDGADVPLTDLPPIVEEAVERLALPFVAIDLARLEPDGWTVVDAASVRRGLYREQRRSRTT